VSLAPILLESGFEHQDALISEAIEEFAARGYDNASINRILARVGMSKGQFYYHSANGQ
jgi:AcrR family transcriptional regulator